MESLLIDAVVYVAGEVGCRNVSVLVNEHDSVILNIYEDAFKQCYLSHGYRILQRMDKGEWVAFKLSYSDGN